MISRDENKVHKISLPQSRLGLGSGNFVERFKEEVYKTTSSGEDKMPVESKPGSLDKIMPFLRKEMVSCVNLHV